MEIIRKDQIINSKVRVCVECGSTLVSQNTTYLKCVDCGTIRYFLA